MTFFDSEPAEALPQAKRCHCCACGRSGGFLRADGLPGATTYNNNNTPSINKQLLLFLFWAVTPPLFMTQRQVHIWGFHTHYQHELAWVSRDQIGAERPCIWTRGDYGIWWFSLPKSSFFWDWGGKGLWPDGCVTASTWAVPAAASIRGTKWPIEEVVPRDANPYHTAGVFFFAFRKVFGYEGPAFDWQLRPTATRTNLGDAEKSLSS